MDSSIADQEAQATIQHDAMLWKTGVQLVSDAMFRLTDAASHTRLSAGTAIALQQGRVLQDKEGFWQIASDKGSGWYEVNGMCACKDAEFSAPEHKCKHIFAAKITGFAQRLTPAILEGLTPEEFFAAFQEGIGAVLTAHRLADATHAPADDWPPEDEQDIVPSIGQTAARGDSSDLAASPTEEEIRAGMITPGTTPAQETAQVEDAALTHKVPKEYIQLVHGRPFVRYTGLVALAHERGLMRLEAQFISVTPELALAWATCEFSDGRRFSDSGDATPSNVGEQIRPHFARMALTRAKARCLRDALNIGICALEELGEEEVVTSSLPPEAWCAAHQSAMEQRTSKKSGKSYWSHRVGQELCFGREKRGAA